MAASFEDFQSILLNSQLVPDKVVYRLSSTKSVPLAAGITAYTEYTFPHGLPFIPLMIGSYSDDNFATSYDFGMGPYEYLPTYGFWSHSLQAHCWADSTNVYVRVISHNTARTVTFHLVGLAPSGTATGDIDIDIPPIQDNFLLSSDFNYLKHAYNTSVSMTTNGLGTYVTNSYSTDVDTPMTLMCFLKEDGKISYGNTMNTITVSGVTLATSTKANNLTISVADTIVKSVEVLIKAYLDA